MIDINSVKSALKIETDADDAYINLLLTAANEYIVSAVGFYPECARADILALMIVSDLYEQRTYTITDDDKKRYSMTSIVLQLQMEYGGDTVGE